MREWVQRVISAKARALAHGEVVVRLMEFGNLAPQSLDLGDDSGHPLHAAADTSMAVGLPPR
jgi:hypothetical protein